MNLKSWDKGTPQGKHLLYVQLQEEYQLFYSKRRQKP